MCSFFIKRATNVEKRQCPLHNAHRSAWSGGGPDVCRLIPPFHIEAVLRDRTHYKQIWEISQGGAIVLIGYFFCIYEYTIVKFNPILRSEWSMYI